MEIKYLFRDLKLNDYEKEYLEKKVARVEKLLSEYQGDEIRAEVEVEKDKKSFFRTEITIKTSHNHFRTDKRKKELFESIDVASDALMRQIRREREKLRDERKKRARERKS